MKKLFRRIVVLAGLAMTMGAGAVSTEETTLIATTPTFAFHSDFEVNLHDALLEAGRDRAFERGELFEEGEEASCFAELPDDRRAGWRHAVAYYAEIVSPGGFSDAQQWATRLELIGRRNLIDADGRVGVEIARGFRAAAAPAYRACRWTAQDKENRAWIGRWLPLLERHEQAIAGRLAALYEKPLDGLPLRADVVETVSWSGANTVYFHSEGGHIFIANGSGEGSLALETIFHEASHVLMSRGAPIPKALGAAARELGVELPRNLWHAVQFYTTGEVVRRALAEAGEPDHVPMMFDGDIFGEFHEALKAEWTGYLEGRKDLAEAARDLVQAVDRMVPGLQDAG